MAQRSAEGGRGGRSAEGGGGGGGGEGGGGGGGGGGLGTHWKPLNTSKRLENPNQEQQGWPGGDNGRGGDDVECGWAKR